MAIGNTGHSWPFHECTAPEVDQSQRILSRSSIQRSILRTWCYVRDICSAVDWRGSMISHMHYVDRRYKLGRLWIQGGSATSLHMNVRPIWFSSLELLEVIKYARCPLDTAKLASSHRLIIIALIEVSINTMEPAIHIEDIRISLLQGLHTSLLRSLLMRS
jgi:hypothetical protein